MGTHRFSENPYPYPPKTCTRDQGYGFLQVQVRVWAEIPQGYPWQSLDIIAQCSDSLGRVQTIQTPDSDILAC